MGQKMDEKMQLIPWMEQQIGAFWWVLVHFWLNF
jgi:hypothetical protein